MYALRPEVFSLDFLSRDEVDGFTQILSFSRVNISIQWRWFFFLSKNIYLFFQVMVNTIGTIRYYNIVCLPKTYITIPYNKGWFGQCVKAATATAVGLAVTFIA